MSSLVKRGSVWYYHRGKPSRPDSVRVSLRVTNKQIAQTLQSELDLAYARTKIGLEQSIMPMSISQAKDEWVKHIEYKKGKEQNGRARPDSHYKKQVLQINKFIDFCKPNLIVRDLTTSTLLDYKTYLLKDYANKTARDYLLCVREFLQFCINKAYLGIPLFDNLPKSFLPSAKPTKKRRPISLRYIKDVIKNAPNEKDRIYWSIMLYTLLRRHDAGTLTLNDIVQGKYQGKTSEPIPLGLPKEIKDNPDVAVMVYPTEYEQRQSLARYKAMMKERDIETDFHAIRHSVATHLSRSGYKESDIKRITGHHSTAVDNYIHAGSEELEILLNNL